jgi:hypothetical protein
MKNWWKEQQAGKEEKPATKTEAKPETKAEDKADVKVEPDVPYFPGHPPQKKVEPVVTAGVTSCKPWTSDTAYAITSVIRPVVANGYYYAAAQGGRSGLIEPKFPLTVGAVVPDGSVVWRNDGLVK